VSKLDKLVFGVQQQRLIPPLCSSFPTLVFIAIRLHTDKIVSSALARVSLFKPSLSHIWTNNFSRKLTSPFMFNAAVEHIFELVIVTGFAADEWEQQYDDEFMKAY
jgi:hypothetical protein